MPSRRTILKALGWSAAGLTVVAAAGAQAFPVLPYRKDPTDGAAAAWVSLRPDGLVELLSPRVEMGQGIARGLCQIVADELAQLLDRVLCLAPDSARIPPVRATVGSDSMRHFALPMAQAGAALAQAVRQRAAARLGTDPAAVTLQAGEARAPDGRTVDFSVLAGGPALLLDAASIAAFRPRFAAAGADGAVGKPAPADDIEAVVTAARPLYAHDIRLPGMLHAAVLRPDGVDGEIVAVDDQACRAIPGCCAAMGSWHCWPTGAVRWPKPCRPFRWKSG